MTGKEATDILIEAYGNEIKKSEENHGNSFRTALLMGANAIKVLEQIKWERDIALQQLEEIGVGLGCKMDGKYLSEEEYEKLIEYKYMYEDLCK